MGCSQIIKLAIHAELKEPVNLNELKIMKEALSNEELEELKWCVLEIDINTTIDSTRLQHNVTTTVSNDGSPRLLRHCNYFLGMILAGTEAPHFRKSVLNSISCYREMF